MNQQILIDAIVRQTMILVARLSTVDGVRSPLSHIVDEVFVGLVAELESQGLGKKVIADMFGLALRSYRQKVQRLRESVTTRGVTLRSAIHDYLSERPSATRSELLTHFKRDEEATVRGILKDLVDSGLVLRGGAGGEPTYRVATAEELEELGTSRAEQSPESIAALVWVTIYRESPVRQDQLSQLLPLPEEALTEAVQTLIKDAQVRRETRADGEVYVTDHCLISVGQAAGWEAAIVDHHRAVLNALAAKLTSGHHASAAKDEIGGTTLTFDLWPGHPREAEVRQLLRATRERVIALWDEVTEYNRDNSPGETYQLTYYCGQYLVEEQE